MARNFKAQDATLTDKIREGQGRIFGEDMEMLERQQSNLSRWPERKLLMLNIDAASRTVTTTGSMALITRPLAAPGMACHPIHGPGAGCARAAGARRKH